MSKKNIITAIFLGLFVFNISLAYGQGLVPAASGPACSAGDATYCGNYEINDFIVLAINASKWILGMVGSLTLVMFIYGGVLFLISGGGSEKISQAKKIIVAAIIGLIIVFSSYLIIQFVLGSMGLTWSGKIAVPQVQ
ncbi:MAG: hypothetical protein WC719_02395 [Patescibacteria group bacterium]|jgi:hypothetical protein